jgi:response regulator RpfG family c-di-GMP phosphodiesterase
MLTLNWGSALTIFCHEVYRMEAPRGTILIVDDEEPSRATLYRKLQADGYNCAVANDGEGALWKTSVQEFDLVLLDLDMPVLSGMEVLPRIVAGRPDTCVVMMTTIENMPSAVEAMKQGAYDYAIKPLNMDDLGMRIEKALEKRRLALENREYQVHLEQKVELQVSQIRKYLYEAVEALGLEQMSLDTPDAVRQAQRYAKRMFQISGTVDEADMRGAYLQMARTLASIAEAREPYASGHADRVGLLANEIAIRLGCSDEMKRQIKFAAILQDIGKIVIPDSILSKQGNLTPADFKEINRHPTASVEIIQHVEYFKDILPLVESHHEWYDGSGGYPKKLKGEQIPLGARILAVADAYDALTCQRPHRPSLTTDQAAQVLKRGAGKQWDPVIVETFLKKLGVTV